MIIQSFDRKSNSSVIKIFGREILSIMRRQKTLSKSQRPESGHTILLKLIRSSTIIPYSIINTVKYKLYYIKDTTKKIINFCEKLFLQIFQLLTFQTYFFRKNDNCEKNLFTRIVSTIPWFKLRLNPYLLKIILDFL